jgi:hypothetical protein
MMPIATLDVGVPPTRSIPADGVGAGNPGAGDLLSDVGTGGVFGTRSV